MRLLIDMVALLLYSLVGAGCIYGVITEFFKGNYFTCGLCVMSFAIQLAYIFKIALHS